MYKVTGQTSANSCGSGLDAPDPWVFDAQLSQDGTTIYWSWMDGNAPLSGSLVSDSASITADESANVDGTDAGLGPCTMARADDLELTFAAGSPPPSFTGTITLQLHRPERLDLHRPARELRGNLRTLPCSILHGHGGAPVGSGAPRRK